MSPCSRSRLIDSRCPIVGLPRQTVNSRTLRAFDPLIHHCARRRPERIGLVERRRVRGCGHARPGSLEIQVPSRKWLCLPARNRSHWTLPFAEQRLNCLDHWLCLALFRHPPGTGCVLSCRCGMSPAATPRIKVAPTVATLRFRKACVFVTITSNRLCLSSTTRAARLHRAAPSTHSWAGAA